MAAKIGVTVPVTGGLSLALAGVSFGLVTWGSSQIAYGIADLNLALNTSDGVRAETYGTLINYIGEALGVDPIAQEILNLAVDIYTGGRSIPTNLYSGEFLKTIEAFRSTGEISEDLINVLKTIHENESQLEKEK